MAAKDLSESTSSLKDTQVKFILTELAAGMTFASAAEKLGGGKEQSRARARAAYDSVLRFRGRVSLTGEESKIVQEKLEALKKRLEALGETF